ncbi:hypothetical protein J9B26_30255, partial [Klebsiella pneumoniae]
VVRSLEACNASFFIFIKISIFTLAKLNIDILDRRKAGSLLPALYRNSIMLALRRCSHKGVILHANYYHKSQADLL